MSIKNIKPNEIILNIPNPSSKTELNLSNSNITNLPSDLSKFTNLYSLDLSNNPLKNYTKIAESLSTLPKLKDLHINLLNPIIFLSSRSKMTRAVIRAATIG